MLDGLLGRGFSSKCKSSIKLTKSRLDVIKRKRNAMQKFLKKDIADLLANGLDINAYGRAEGLSGELNLSSCYDIVEQSCECITKHLSVMQKQRECPEDCREAVSSLMFAAARFADLPELRDLRDIFTARYGNFLEPFVNKEFVENLASKPPTMEKKLQLMREISQEFSIKWDSKGFEKKISNSPLSAQDRPKRQGSVKDPKIDGNKLYNSRDEIASKIDNQDPSSRGRRALSDDGYKLHSSREETALEKQNQDVPSHGRRGSSEDGYKQRIEVEETVLKRDHQDVHSHRRWESTDDKYKPQKGSDDSILKRNNHDVLSQQEYINDAFKPRKGRDDTILKRDDIGNLYQGRRNHDDGNGLHNRRADAHRSDNQDIKREYPTTKQKVKMDGEDIPLGGDNHKAPPNRANLMEKASNGDESMRPFYKKVIPPPYVKANGGKSTARDGTSDQATYDRNKAPIDPSVNDRSERSQTGLERVANDERQVARPARVNGLDDEHVCDDQDDLVSDIKAKPRSVRRRHLKPPAGQDYRGNIEGDENTKNYPNGRRREDARRGSQHALDEDRDTRDEDEKMMDKLLVHYSKKPSKFEPIKVRGALNSPQLHQEVADAGEPQRHRRKDVANLKPEPVPPPARAVSLPPEPVTPTEIVRAPARATSFQPDMLNPGGHVHPKLPDYDDLAARFAALRGR